MYRFALEFLKKWANNLPHKPLIIRGARQVGKSTLVSIFAKAAKFDLLVLNFEKNPEFEKFFLSNNPAKIISLLETIFNKTIKAGSSLLFLDEIQAKPQVLSVLRYFYEEMPDLHIICAGSLLDFELNSPTFSMPVGRISYMHLHPMSFGEYLQAINKTKLSEFIINWHIKDEMPEPIHQALMQNFKEYLVVGGMPEAVKTYVKSKSYQKTQIVKQDLLATFNDDFAKYSLKNNYELIRLVFNKIPINIGNKVKYSNLSSQNRAKDIATAVNQLANARVVNKVVHSSANGIPLQAQEKQKFYKLIFLDVGLVATMLNVDYLSLENGDLMMINSGAIAEQWVGQALISNQDFNQKPYLNYWIREKKSSSAELDYIISVGREIIGIEVKAGKTGTLRSLHQFMQEKNHKFAVRFNSEPPSLLKKPYILSLPLYLAEECRRLCLELQKTQ
ncbi:MAG: AAA family ATPase [Gammaproteobacteria bacterium]|nr:MAG: AAA family ATPase [Gammaproteobacteria bacterium]